MKIARGLIEFVADIGTILLVVAAVSVIWSRWKTPESAGGQGVPTEPRHIEDWNELSEGAPRLGKADATIRVVEFVDYECPFCRRSEEVLRALRDSFPDDVAVFYRHFPLASHAGAFPAARFAECARDQNRFEAVHNFLMRAVSLVDLDPIVVAHEGQIPRVAEFEACVRTKKPDDRINDDLAMAERLELAGVPAIIVEGVLLQGAPRVSTLVAMVDSIRSDR